MAACKILIFNSSCISMPLYPWQGQVISTRNRSGYTHDLYNNRVPIIPVRQTSYGEPDGLWGINCHHSPPDPIIPGISTQRTPPPAQAQNDALYKQSQVQRRFGQKVWEAKRETLCADATGDKDAFAKAAQKVNQKQADLKQYVASTGGTLLHCDRTQVFGYNRSVSGKAAAANKATVKKYPTAHAPATTSSALRFTDRHKTDALFRPETEALCPKLSKVEKCSAYEYTVGSGKFNRSLRGYSGDWGHI